MTTPSLALGTFSHDGGVPVAGLVLDGRETDLRRHLGAAVSVWR